MRKLLRNILWSGTFLLLVYSSAGLAQARFIPLNVDYAVFNAGGDAEYVEVYLSFLQRLLQYVPGDSGMIANFTLQIEISNDQGVQFSKQQSFFSSLENNEEISNYHELRHLFACQLTAGRYQAKLTLIDSNSGARGEYISDLEVHRHSDAEMTLSDIQLAVKIAKAQQRSKFNKNGLLVVPNPAAVYHVGMPVLYYYAEAYNLPFNPDSPGGYTVEFFITNGEGEVIRRFPPKQYTKPGSSAVLVGGNNIVTLPSATHFLHLRFTDTETGQSIEKSKRFTMYKPSQDQIDQVQSMTTRLMTTYYSKFSEEELDKEFEQLKYIATKEEIETYRSLEGSQGKSEMLVEFWKRRDSDPSTPQNEFKIAYFQKVEYTKEHFRTKFKEGWKTDRGRILLTYGPPDEIERSPMEGSKKPYEVWSYNDLDGGSIFVFADLQGFGEYELLHSSYRRELSQPDWQRLIEVQRNRNSQLNFR